MNVTAVAEQALREIAAHPKNSVVGSRRGQVAAANLTGKGCVVFRRIEGKVRMELWGTSSVDGRSEPIVLPADLERRAAEMLDNL